MRLNPSVLRSGPKDKNVTQEIKQAIDERHGHLVQDARAAAFRHTHEVVEQDFV